MSTTNEKKKYKPYNAKKGVGFGLIAGLIAYLVLYVPTILTLYPQLLTNAAS